MAGWQKFKQQAVKQEDHFKRKAGRRWILFVGMVFALLCSAGAARVQATPTVTVDSVTLLRAPTTTEIPMMRSTGASVDGTFNTIFRVHYTITPATNTGITGASIKIVRGMPNDQTFSLPATSGSGTFDIAGYFLVSQNASKTSNTFWGGSYSRTVQVSAISNETTNNTASATSPSIVVGPSGREVLIPLDSNNQPDLFRPHSGGLTVTPADGANDDDGTSSSTYTFRVLYRHPDGLPPLAVYNSRVDPWRFPITPDVTLPSGVNTASVATGIGLYFDDNAAQDCNEIADPQNPGHVLGRQLDINSVINGYIPVMHFMVPETNNNPTADDYRNGVVYIYRMIPTSHEVAVGMPGNFYSRVSFLQNLVAQFGQLFGFRGLRYIDGDMRLDQFSNNRLTSGTDRQDPRYSAPFLALAAGPHAYTFRCTSDPTVAGYDANTNLVSAVYRYPDYNAPALGGTSNQPALVFPEPNKTTGMQFDKPTVNPALDTDVATAPDSPANYPIRIATPLTIPNPLRQGVSPANKPEVLLVNATRALSAETVRFRVYYRQSDNVAPLSVTLLLFAKSGSGFSATPTQMEAMLEEAPGTYATGKAFYRDIQLPPGEYRYYFRA
ncbi:MAG TPA: hypothetical protein VHR86_10625, partial [Armatimonadota bacterium]|nr:hypothetical protein [Armatimonadota bacterium]